MNHESVEQRNDVDHITELTAEVKGLLSRNSNPWRSDTKENSGDNWLIASFGRDHKDIDWILTTDSVRASGLHSDADDDVRFCVAARRLLMALIEDGRL